MEEMQLNAGVLLSSFTPATAEVSGIIGATTGGIKFAATPTYSDFGEDIDNCPKNMKELKRQDSVEVKISGTFVTVTTATAKKLMAAADIDTSDTTKITPRNDLTVEDFADLWWVGDYSDKNGEKNGGFVAIHVMNALNTGGFQLQSGDKSKGQFPFEFTGHYSIEAQDVVPYEVYIKAGTAEA
jgi:hypothetical protein